MVAIGRATGEILSPGHRFYRFILMVPDCVGMAGQITLGRFVGSCHSASKP